jgi:molybdopterin/thiamine biosynthesis adenylyltransferase
MRFTDEEIGRYARQMALPEVGGLGQERLRAARARAASALEALYLAAAGVGHLEVPTAEVAAQARALNPLVTVEVGGGPGADDGDPDGALAATRRATRTLLEILRP